MTEKDYVTRFVAIMAKISLRSNKAHEALSFLMRQPKHRPSGPAGFRARSGVMPCLP